MMWNAGLAFFCSFGPSCGDIFSGNNERNVNIRTLLNITALSFIISQAYSRHTSEETKNVKLWEIYISYIPFF